MYRYNENWENYSAKYDSNLKKNLETNDFSIRGTFSFWKNFLKFNGRRVFSTLPPTFEEKSKLSTMSSYTLEMIFSPVSNLVLSQTDSGVGTIEGEYHLWQNDTRDHSVRMYGKHVIEGMDNITTTNQIVYNYGLDYMLNAGVRDWKVMHGDKMLTPETFTLGGMMRFSADPKLHSWGGMQFAFGTKSFTEVKALVGLSMPDINGVLQLALQRKSETVITPLTTNGLAEKISYPKELKVGLEARVADYFILFNTFKSTMGADILMQTDLGGLYTFDPYTTFKFKISDDMSTTLSLTRRFSNLFDFTFSTAITLKRPAISELQTSTATISTPTTTTTVAVTTPKNIFNHINSKFGLAIEILDDSLI